MFPLHTLALGLAQAATEIELPSWLSLFLAQPAAVVFITRLIRTVSDRSGWHPALVGFLTSMLMAGGIGAATGQGPGLPDPSDPFGYFAKLLLFGGAVAFTAGKYWDGWKQVSK